MLGSTYTVSESGTAGPTGGTTRNRTPYVFLLLLLPPTSSSSFLRPIGGYCTRWIKRDANGYLSGYVAVAVATAQGTYTREEETGSTDREANMVAFVRVGLTLLRDVMLGRGSSL